MTAMVALWVLGPAVLFLALSLYVALIGVHTRKLDLRGRLPVTAPTGRRPAPLVNVMRTGEPRP